MLGLLGAILLFTGVIRPTSEAIRDLDFTKDNPYKFNYVPSEQEMLQEIETMREDLKRGATRTTIRSTPSSTPTPSSTRRTTTTTTTTTQRPTTSTTTQTTTTTTKATTTTPTPKILPVELVPVHYMGSTFSVHGEGICTNNTQVIILIQSAPTHRETRMMIRKTWGALHQTQKFADEQFEQEVRIGYMFGESYDERSNADVLEESILYKDVIVSPFHDSYRNLTLKSLASLQWVDTYCPSAKYFVKCDDDTIVHVPNLLRFLQVNGIDRGMVGALGKDLEVQRTGRWSVDIDVYPTKIFPPYYSGPAYVIRTELIKELLTVARTTPMIPIEDAYVTGILATLVGARRFAPGGFAYTSSRPPTTCDVRGKQFYSGSNLSPEYMSYIYSSLTVDLYCPDEVPVY